jgi:hypothetical protein
MATAKKRPSYKRLLTVLLVTCGVIILSVVGLHIWFVNNARGVLKNMVHTKSNGKIKLELSKITFDFFSKKLQVREADLTSTDSITQPTTYHIKFRKLTLRVNSFWPLLFQKKLQLDSIKLHDPLVEVMQWRRDTTQKRSDDELSVTQEMGKLYNSMLDVLDDFGIRRIIINNAQLSLINKMKAFSDPVTISKIYFDLKRTGQGGENRDSFLVNRQSVELETTDQHITLPGGRHRLSFKRFHLELFRKHIQLDSCTVSALATDSSKSSYTIFFNKLMLVGVDFEAMYQRNLIKADSVYCENPLFDINLNTMGRSANKKGRPDPEQIIQELTGDLDLAFIGVKDAGIHIDITGKTNRSLFNSNKDDFEMRGLRINADSSKPVVVERFDMLVRDYRLYSDDSSAVYTFDSINFNNNKIILRNFTVSTELNFRNQHNYRDFRIPYFELSGLDWYELIFEENLKAREAQLYNPVINYVTAGTKRSRKKTDLFSALQSVGNLVTLNKINVVNGQINMKLGPTSSFSLQNANLSLLSNQLLQSQNREGLRQAIERLSFSNGILKLKDITAQLQNVRSTNDKLIIADRISLTSANNKVSGFLNSVVINNMLLDDFEEKIVIDGIIWQSAAINLKTAAKQKNKKGVENILIKNIAGNNTQLNFDNGQIAASTFVNSLKLVSLIKHGAKPFKTEGLLLSGTKLNVTNKDLKLTGAEYGVFSNKPSFLSGVFFEQIKEKDTLNVKTPRIEFTADINELLANNLRIEKVALNQPVINFTKWNTGTQQKESGVKSDLRIDRIVANEPVINIALHKNDSVSLISLPPSVNSYIQASDLLINSTGVKLGSLSVKTTAATFVKPGGEIIGVENGNVDLQLNNLLLSNNGNKSSWSGTVTNLFMQNPASFSVGKSKSTLLLNELSLGNLNLSSDYLSDFNQLIKYNVAASLRTGTGNYTDSNTTLNWHNAEYSYKNKTFTLDSFFYHPTQSRDSVIANTPHQTDYITFQSGAVKITDFNLEAYNKDSAILANTINITNPIITIYRDKGPPFLGGRIKPLPVDMIENIKLPVSVKRLNLFDGLLTYTERNAKTRAEGTLYLTNLNGGLSNIKNTNISETDSLTLNLNAFLMDSAQINLRVRESYADSLSGFLMTLRMRPTTLSFLNPVLAPLSNVIIKSGTIDSLQLRAIGREELSLGEMKMYYRNLRIKLIKDGQYDQSTFIQNVASFLANTFIIKKNNKGRTGLVYFERLRDRSFFNYIVKMTFSGMATSVGVKSNRKYRKLYEKELKERALPPIEFE